MISRLVKRGFAVRLFNWGSNHNNLGRPVVAGVALPDTPFPLGDSLSAAPKKLVSGLSESIVLGASGDISAFGIKYILPIEPLSGLAPLNSHLIQHKSFVDADLGFDRSVFLNSEGEVYEIESGKPYVKVEIGSKARLVAAGRGFSLAVVETPAGDSIFAWGLIPNTEHQAIFNEFSVGFRKPSPLAQLEKLLRKANSKVAKLRAVEHGAVLLLDNGQLLSWGCSDNAQLGKNHSILALRDHMLFRPIDPVAEAGLNEKIEDFELSDNVLCVKTRSGKVFFCGMNGTTKLTEVTLPDDHKAATIGASHNHYFVVTESGKIFSNAPLEGETKLKFYGDFNLYEIDRKYFDGQKVISISGKYENVLAVAN